MGVAKQNKIERLIIHCSASPDEIDLGVAEINKWHKVRGFSAYDGKTFCGYHYVVRRDGTIEQGRPEGIVGAHTAGHNTGSLGLCWIGMGRLGARQRQSIIELCVALLRRHNLNENDIHGHNDFTDRKTCPNFNNPMTFMGIEHFRETVKLTIQEREGYGEVYNNQGFLSGESDRACGSCDGNACSSGVDCSHDPNKKG